MKFKLFYTFLLSWICVFMSAQQMTISGTVTDSKDGSAMPGVNVLIKGTTKGTVTNIDGFYSLSANANDIVSFSFVGYTTKEMTVESSTTLNVALEPQVTGLDEIVVIGYGVQKKSDKTGAVANVGSDELNKGSLSDPIQGLQGKVAGVSITKKGGDPSTGFSVNIRGQAGLYSKTEPLYVVDGVPGVDPTTIAPEDIETFNILKDASSTAIYGARASNGVVLISTKKGKSGQSSISYNSYIAFDNVAKRMDLLSASELRKYVEDNKLPFNDGGANTDWQDEIYRTGLSQSHNITFNGGSESNLYSASITHNSIEGVIKGTNKIRDIGRINLTQKAFDNKLTINATMSGTIEHNDYIQYDGYGPKDVLYQAFIRNPTDPVKNPDGTYYEVKRDFNYSNPLNSIDNIQNQRDAKRYMGSLKLDYEIVKDLNTGITLSYIRDDNENFYFVPSNPYAQPNGEGKRNYDNNASKILEYTINYNKSINDVHNLSIVGGYSYQEDMTDGFFAKGKSPISSYVQSNNLGFLTSIGLEDIGSYKEENKIISFFGRATYNYNSKYYLTGTLRKDGSSKFGANHKWGTFPSASVAWNIANEDFIKSSTLANIVNQFKFRIGWGLAGNQRFDRYSSLEINGIAGTQPDPETGKPSYMVKPLINSNPDVKWEENEELNFGLDFGILKNRISGSLEYYRKTTHDLLAKYEVPQPPNRAPKTWANAGQIDNNGFEANLQLFLVDKKSITWKSVFTYSTNRQKLVKLDDSYYHLKELHAGYLSGRNMSGVWTQKIAPGYELGTFYGWKYVGLNEKGKFQFLSYKGDTTIKYDNDSDRMVIGHALPRYEFGFSNYFTIFKYFDLSFAFRGVMGFDVLNVTKMVFSNPNGIPNFNATKDVFEEIDKGLNDDPKYSDYYIEDGSFIRLENITLGYTYNFKNLKYLKNIRVYGTIGNVFTITNYSGVDPETSYSFKSNDDLSFGIDQYNVYPKTRTYTFGLNLTF